MMKSIGVRELRQYASRYLRDVERGERLQVTDRGRPVALLIPMPRDRLAELEAQGRLRRGRGDPLAVKPVRPKKGVPLPSEILARMRAGEPW